MAAEGFRRLPSRALQGRLLAAGGLLLAVAIAEVTLILAVDREAGWALVAGLGIEMMAGREAGIPVALAGGAPPWVVAQLSWIQDVAIGCLAFPAFLVLLERYRDRNTFLMRKLRDLETAAQHHQRFLRRWGPFGVFLFMLVPFLINGPLVGAVAGRIAGIRTRYLLLPVSAATAVAAAAWTYAYDALFAAVGGLHPLAAPVLTGALVGALLTAGLVQDLRRQRRHRTET